MQDVEIVELWELSDEIHSFILDSELFLVVLQDVIREEASNDPKLVFVHLLTDLIEVDLAFLI